MSSDLERPATEIDPTVLLLHHGLDSVFCVNFCIDLEHWFGTPIDAMLVWDDQTIYDRIDLSFQFEWHFQRF